MQLGYHLPMIFAKAELASPVASIEEIELNESSLALTTAKISFSF